MARRRRLSSNVGRLRYGEFAIPIRSNGLDASLTKKLDAFIESNSFPDLYKSYAWQKDTYAAGFPEIFRLETQLSRNEKSTGVTLDDVGDVARWWKKKYGKKMHGQDVVLPKHTLTNADGTLCQSLEGNPCCPLALLQSISGFGPTYQSKDLRFSLAEEYGAIDTWCVRVFGQGDPNVKKQDWLKIRALQSRHKGEVKGWYIPEAQAYWPSDYAIWINILRYFSEALPQNCPHPEIFVSQGLRVKGRWVCADVEMALFSFAFQKE